MFTNDHLARLVKQLEQRIASLEHELRGIRSQREPRITTKRRRYQAVVSEPGGIAAGGVGEVTIYADGSPTTWTPQAHNKWMHGNLPVAFDTEVVVEWYDDRNAFHLDGVGCAAGGDHEALP